MSRLVSRMTPGGGPRVSYALVEFDFTGSAETMLTQTVSAIPEGALVLSARVKGSLPAAPAGSSLGVGVLMGGEDPLFMPNTEEPYLATSGGPALVTAFGVVAIAAVGPVDEMNPPDPAATLGDVGGTVEIEIAWTRV